MQFAFSVATYFADLLLDVLIIAALLRIGYRRYFFLLLYVIADFLTTVIEIQPSLAYSTASPAAKVMYADMYWWNERIIQVLVFAMVISLIYMATAQVHPRRGVFAVVVLGTAIFGALTFLIQFDRHLPSWRWMTYWTRDLNFGAAILDLGLWAALIGSRKKDYRLLMISGALGIQFTGGAIGQAFRGMSDNWAQFIGDCFYLTNLTCLYIWWQAFRAPEKTSYKSRPRPDSEPARIHRPSPE